MRRSLLSTPLVPLVLAAGAAAQSDARSPVAPALRVGRVPIHTATPEGALDYGVWAATDSYKVSFHGDATFIPYLGDAVPENQSFAWRTSAVTIGESAIEFDATSSGEASSFRYERALGRNVAEIYDVLESGLEQSFVVRALPTRSGDLVVRGRITTPLRAAATAARHGAIDFLDAEGREVIRYGAAFAIDASGRRTEALTAYRDGEIELRVPAAWVAGAALPIAIDPLLSRSTLFVTTPPRSVDVIRDDTGNDLMVAFTRGASATDQDLYALMTTDSWGSVTTVFTDVTATWNTDSAKVAAAASPQTYCVAFERHLPQRKIRAHLHDSGDFALRTTVIGLEPPTGNHDWRPDVGGQVLSGSAFTPTGSKFLIVFQRDFTGSTTFSNTNTSMIYGRTLDANGTLDAEFPIAISVLAPIDHEWPSVNQQGKRTGSAASRSDWLVVFQLYSGPGATWRAYGKLVRDDGTLSSSTWISSSNGSSSHRMTPRVGGHSGRYLVSFVESSFSAVPFKTSSTLGHSLRSERVDWTAGGNPVNFPERILDGPGAQAIFELGDVAYDSSTTSHWAIAMHTDRAAGGSGRALVLRAGFQGLETERQILFDPAGATDQGFSGGICFDSDADEFAMAFAKQDAVTGLVYGNRLAYRTPSAVVVSGSSCSSAQIAWVGSRQIGNEFASVRLTGAPANASAFLFLSVAPADLNLSLFGMNGCRLLVDTAAYVSVPATASAAGNATIPLPLSEDLPAATGYFQWFHTDLGANPLNLVSTQRMQVEIIK